MSFKFVDRCKNDRVYENVELKGETTSGNYDQVSIKSSYDEVSLNFGKPVILGAKGDNIFETVSFQSPIEDLNAESRDAILNGTVFPTPAPRPSKSRSERNNYENFDLSSMKVVTETPLIYEVAEGKSPSSSSASPPIVPPRNSILKPESPTLNENLYSEVERNSERRDDNILDEIVQDNDKEEKDFSSLLGARPKNRLSLSKIRTLDIRNVVERMYDEAEEEANRDMSLDLSVFDSNYPPKPVIQPKTTLLRDFDPCFKTNPLSERLTIEEIVEEDETSLENEDMSSSMKKEMDDDETSNRRENEYVILPYVDLPPPSSPPPPLPNTSPPPLPPNKPKYYENVWPAPSGKQAFTLDSSVVETTNNALKNDSTSPVSSCPSTSASSSASSLTSNEISVTTTQRSQSTSSTINLSKMASHLKRKMSDQVLKRSILLSDPIRFRRHSHVEGAAMNKPGTTKNHNGVLFLWSRSKKIFQSKWCVLGNGTLQYFNEKDSLVVPKELILLSSVLSLTKLQKRPGPTADNNEEETSDFYCFDICYTSRKGSRFCAKTFGARSAHERETWLERITQSLNYKLSKYSMAHSTRLGWAFMKEGFAGSWSTAWMSLTNRCLSYTTSDDSWEVVDLRKTKDITLKRNVKYLEPPVGQVPVLVIDFVDRSLYIVINSEEECINWCNELQSKAFANGSTLIDQQMTAEDIPVIVDKCVKFVFSQGCMSEGIYRQSGVKTKIDRLLGEFKKNAWAVQISKKQYSEHDVANAIKRFMRTLEEPLLTEGLRSDWMATSTIEDSIKRNRRYKELLKKLPVVNYNTLRRLISHLNAVSAQCEKNLMPNYNLASIWGPTLLTVDGQKATDFAKTSGESDVCRDLIEHYAELFDVKPDELERERLITEVLEQISPSHERGQHGHLKRSGDLRMWVYIDTKTSGNCVCLVVQPSMTALEMTRRVLAEVKREKEENLFLHEIVLGGALERPLHHSEIMLDLTLSWGSWKEEDRQNNYLLLKRNVLYEEALPCAVPPLSVSGEAYYGENKAKSKFVKHLFSMNNAKVTCYRNTKSGIPVEVGSWPIEEIKWYLGAEEKRKTPYRLNITFIEKEHPVLRTKEKPYFGHTISFEQSELFIKWIAAMLVAEYPNDVSMPAALVVTNS